MKLFYNEIYKGLGGLWFAEVTKENGHVYGQFKWTTKKGLQAKLKEIGAEKVKKQCLICGNEKPAELEPATLFSNGEGNDDEINDWICKEDKGCNA